MTTQPSERAQIGWSKGLCYAAAANSGEPEDRLKMQHRPDTSWIGTQKTDFWDRSQKFRYLIMTEVARRLVQQPELLERGRHYLETSMANEKQLAPFYQAWKAVIDRPAEEIVRRWLADTDEGDMLRANPPLFDVVEGDARKRASAEATAWARHSHGS